VVDVLACSAQDRRASARHEIGNEAGIVAGFERPDHDGAPSCELGHQC